MYSQELFGTSQKITYFSLEFSGIHRNSNKFGGILSNYSVIHNNAQDFTGILRNSKEFYCTFKEISCIPRNSREIMRIPENFNKFSGILMNYQEL
jgi:hypothetical protein